MNGPSEYEGRVEYCINGVWSGVCDNEWNTDTAMTVCTQLGIIKGTLYINIEVSIGPVALQSYISVAVHLGGWVNGEASI